MSIFLTAGASLRSALQARPTDRPLTSDAESRSMTSSLTITRFAGHAASVNSWVITNATHAFVIDALRSESEAAELAETIRATGKTLHGVLVTHGHPDHYIRPQGPQAAVPGGAHP